jgi:hypothetical protein
MTNVHGIKVAGATFPAQIWHDYMEVAKRSYCGKFPKPTERPELAPFCGRLAATTHCAVPNEPVDPTAAPADPVAAAGAQPQQTTSEPAPVPIPDTAITGRPPSETAARSAVFTFSASGAAAKGYECSVDGGAFSKCSSPANYGHLAPGQHVFSVRALSPAGKADDTPANYSWTVFDDLVPPSEQKQPAEQQTPPKKKQSQPPPQIVG